MNPQCELTIEDCSVRGFGLAPHPTQKAKVEVAHAIPGDRVRVELMRRKRAMQKGRLLELLASSEFRVEPRCQHASLCGGCSWQAMDYEAQIAQKEKMVRKAFKEIPLSHFSLLRCEDPWRYRNKMEFTFSENRAGTRFLGLMIAHAEPYVFNLEQCHIAPAWMSECLGRVRSWWERSGLKAYHPHQNTGVLRYLTLRDTRMGQKMAILNVSEWKQEYEEGLLEAIGEGSAVVRVHHTKRGIPTSFSETVLAGPDHMVEELRLSTGILRFIISPSSFFQPNPHQAERLYDLVLQALGNEKLVYDLYCGAGTLSLAAASRAEHVVGIELHAQAVSDARENATFNGISNVQFYQGDTGAVLSQLSGKPNAVIVDPPRAGLDEQAIRYLRSLQPQKIIYVSCNPVTQAENIRALGYDLVSLKGVDQFPHTPHIETVALLDKGRSELH